MKANFPDDPSKWTVEERAQARKQNPKRAKEGPPKLQMEFILFPFLALLVAFFIVVGFGPPLLILYFCFWVPIANDMRTQCARIRYGYYGTVIILRPEIEPWPMGD